MRTPKEEAGLTKRGAVSSAIRKALADTLPKPITKASFLDSNELAEAYGKLPQNKLSEKEKEGVSKALGRMLKKNQITEYLTIKQSQSYGSGLVAISVNLSKLRQEWEEWEKSPDRYGKWNIESTFYHKENVNNEQNTMCREPTQEAIADMIIHKTKKWMHKTIIEQKNLNKEEIAEQHLQIIVTGIDVIHGSESFDILMKVLYQDQKQFLRYIREVIQMVDCVDRTHTMQISSSGI